MAYTGHMTRRSYRRRHADTDAAGAFVLIVIIAGITAHQKPAAQTVRMIALLAILLVAAVSAAVLFWYLNQAARTRQKLRALQMASVDALSGLQFEKYVGELLRSQGYRTEYTPHTDLGVDIIAAKHGVRLAVQVKCYSSSVGVKAINEVVGGRNNYHCQQTMVVTNSHFTPAARRSAESNDTLLIDRDKLAGWIVSFQQGAGRS